MKIFFPTVFYLPDASGGIEYYIQHLAKGLRQRGHDVSIVLPAYPDDINKQPYVHENLQVIRYFGFPAVGKNQITGLIPNDSLQHFRKLLDDERPDIVHFNQLTNSGGISLWHLRTARETGAKVVFTSHMADFFCRRGDLLEKGKHRCDGVIKATKCSACVLASRGMTYPMRNILLAGDAMVLRFFGKENFMPQVNPITFPGFASRWHIHKLRTVIREADAFVSISRWSSEILKKNSLFSENCHTIPNGLFGDTQVPQTPIAIYGCGDNLRILYMGRVVAEKGLKILINAVLSMRAAEVELHVYGPAGLKCSATYLEECKSMSAGSSNIFFFPQVPVGEVISVMRKHHILCLPSLAEMAPLVIQEARAAGIPIIGSDLPAISEWITDGKNGLLFNTGNVASLQQKLEMVLDKPECLDVFRKAMHPPVSFSSVVDRYDEVYRKVLHLT